MFQELPINCSKTSAFSCQNISIIVKTYNQSILNQPCLWLIHGSGGISSEFDIWEERAFKEGYTLIIVDSYSNRGIYKQMWENMDEYRIDPKQRAIDVIHARNFLLTKSDIIPFANIFNSKTVGFSDGGTACIWLQQNEFEDAWIYSYALYPGLKTNIISTELYNIRKDKLHIFVGAEDNWTPAFYDVEYQKITGCKINVWPDTYHSFSKPGIDHYHTKILNYKREKGVYCKYNAEMTKKTMDIVFNVR